MKRTKALSINAYIRSFPAKTQKLLRQMRATVRAAAPDAQETISYAIPTFTLHGNLVHFAAYEKHIGFYPTPAAIQAFSRELAAYESAKGSVRFPLDEPLPLGLIARMVRFRVAQNLKGAPKRARLPAMAARPKTGK